MSVVEAKDQLIVNKRGSDYIVEGYWKSASEPKLPMPIEGSWVDEEQIDPFLDMLDNVQAKAQKEHYRGWSTCRLCGIHNGSAEYRYKGFLWPVGLAHYIDIHGVKPSRAFRVFVKENGKRLRRRENQYHGESQRRKSKGI